MRVFAVISIFTVTLGRRLLPRISQSLHLPAAAMARSRLAPAIATPLLALATAKPVTTRSNPGLKYGQSFQNLVADPVADAAFKTVDWVPNKSGAQAVLEELKGTRWPRYTSRGKYGTMTTADAAGFISFYTGCGSYSTNVERVSRGAVALNSSHGAVADVFDTDPIEATALAMHFTAGLCAQLALLPAKKNAQTLFRGASEPPTMLEKLQDLNKAGDTFIFPGLASTAVDEEHAKSYMGKGPYRQSDGLDMLYEFQTKQAKDVTHINPDESEWILPPNRKFHVLSITKEKRYSSDYYHVKLKDA